MVGAGVLPHMKLTKRQKAHAFAQLRRFLSGAHWAALNERRGALIDIGICSDELSALQSLASLRRQVFAPYPIQPVPRRGMLKKVS